VTRLEITARDLALKLHAGQTYGGGNGALPYSFHLAAVVGVLARFGCGDVVGVVDVALFIAAWLHDTLEDTAATDGTLRAGLAPRGLGWHTPMEHAAIHRAVTLVHAVTDPTGEDGEKLSRREKLALVIAQVQAAGPDAVTLKLADRIANVEASVLGASPLLAMYQQEYPAFREGLRHAGGTDAMWAHLDALLGRT
jgi:(p)ppGpp synthase/HD superfamily hydrolase